MPKPTPSGNSEAIAKLEAARRRIDEQIAEQQLAAQLEEAEAQARAAWVEMSGEKKEKVDSPEQSPHWGDDSKWGRRSSWEKPLPRLPEDKLPTKPTTDDLQQRLKTRDDALNRDDDVVIRLLEEVEAL